MKRKTKKRDYIIMIVIIVDLLIGVISTVSVMTSVRLSEMFMMTKIKT